MAEVEVAQVPVPPSRRGVSQDIVRAARRQRSIRLHNARKEQWRHRGRRLRRAFLATSGIYIAALVTALVVGGLAWTPTLLTLVLGMAVFVVLSIYPATPRTHADDLNTATLPELAGSTELWLEGKRRALPNAAVDTIDLIGVRLEQLAPQLAVLDERGPAAHEVRKLLTEHLPSMVDSYTRIPAALRGKRGAVGTTPSDQLVDGLAVIADQIEAMSEDLSQGDIDALATRMRFLETRYVDP